MPKELIAYYNFRLRRGALKSLLYVLKLVTIPVCRNTQDKLELVSPVCINTQDKFELICAIWGNIQDMFEISLCFEACLPLAR